MCTSKQSGFTLVEIMVVLVVLGLFAGMAILTMGQNDNLVLEREAKRLFEVIKLAQDEAIMHGTEIGLTVQSDKYYFSRLQENKWLKLGDDQQLGVHKIAGGIELELRIENDKVIHISDPESESESESESELPEIILLSSGEITAFEINLEQQPKQAASFQVTGQDSGELLFQTPDSL